MRSPQLRDPEVEAALHFARRKTNIRMRDIDNQNETIMVSVCRPLR